MPALANPVYNLKELDDVAPILIDGAYLQWDEFSGQFRTVPVDLSGYAPIDSPHFTGNTVLDGTVNVTSDIYQGGIPMMRQAGNGMFLYLGPDSGSIVYIPCSLSAPGGINANTIRGYNWNQSSLYVDSPGITYTAYGESGAPVDAHQFNIVNALAFSGSNIANFQIGGVSRAALTKDGQLQLKASNGVMAGSIGPNGSGQLDLYARSTLNIVDALGVGVTVTGGSTPLNFYNASGIDWGFSAYDTSSFLFKSYLSTSTTPIKVQGDISQVADITKWYKGTTEVAHITADGGALFNGQVGMGGSPSTPGISGRLHVLASANMTYGLFDAPTSGYAYHGYRYNGTAIGYLGQGTLITGAAATDFGLRAENNLQLGAGGTVNHWTISSSGHFLAGTDASFDLGATGFRPRNANISGAYTGGYLNLETNASPTVAPAGKAALAFDGTNLKLSISGGAYATVGTGGGSSYANLVSETANALALRNGGNGQILNVYNTYTNSTNYERGFVSWFGNTFYVGTEKSGTGLNRAMRLVSGATNQQIILDSNGTHFTADAGGNDILLLDGSGVKFPLDNAYSIGASASNRPKDYFGGGHITVGGHIVATSFIQSGSSYLQSGVSSGISIYLGPNATSSHIALKKTGTTMEVRLADDSGFATQQDLFRRVGAGSPEGVITAPVGAVYHRTDGGAASSLYVKESGTSNTGWTAK